jgi:hypothetical protein
MHHSYASYGQSPYMATFHDIVNNVGQRYSYREKGLLSESIARQLTNPRVHTQFLSHHIHWSSRGKVKHLLLTSYISLLGAYHQHVIITFNTCSRVPTPRSLTDTSGSYNNGDAGFLHHTTRPSQLMVLLFPLMDPPSLRLTISIQASSN